VSFETSGKKTKRQESGFDKAWWLLRPSHCRALVGHSLGKGEVVSSILTGSTMKSPTDKGLSNVRKNSRCEFVQNETRSDAWKRTKSAPNVRQMFARRT
jgi:hypothetical protein